MISSIKNNRIWLIIFAVALVFAMTIGLSGCGSEETTEKPKTYSVGDTAEVEGMTVTISSATLFSGDEWDTPAAGNQYLVIQCKVENTTDENYEFIDSYDIVASVDGKTIEPTYLLDDSHPELMGTIGAGNYIEGYLVYEIPTDFEEVTLKWFGDSYSEFDEITYKLTPEDCQ